VLNLQVGLAVVAKAWRLNSADLHAAAVYDLGLTGNGSGVRGLSELRVDDRWTVSRSGLQVQGE
jgi:hypothetical protein